MDRFNAPPTWPQPPAGWRPVPGWRPEAYWAPAPAGWSFWVDDFGRPTDGPAGLFGSKNTMGDSTYGIMPGAAGAFPRGHGAVLAESGSGGWSTTKKSVVGGFAALVLFGGWMSAFGQGKKPDAAPTSIPSATSTASSSAPASSSSSASPVTSASSRASSPVAAAATDAEVNDRSSATAVRTTRVAPSSTVQVPSTASAVTPRSVVTPAPAASENVDPTTAEAIDDALPPSSAPTTQEPQYLAPQTTEDPAPAAAYYSSCKAAKAAGAGPFYRGQPGYVASQDRDDDGVACE